MVRVTLSSPTPSTTPADGWRVEYRVKGTSGGFITALGSPFTSLPIIFNTNDAAGTLYEINVWGDCGALESTKFATLTPCSCTTAGYNPSGDECRKVESVSATVINSGYCLVASKNATYGLYGSRVYKKGLSNATLFLPAGTSNTYIEAEMTASPQWCNPSGSTTIGPMNREGVWIDSDCNGVKNSLTSGAQTTIAFMVNNTGVERDIYIGVAGDNEFKLIVNGAVIVDTSGNPVNSIQFRFWHLIPVTLKRGTNYFNAVATGDGSTNDSIAMVGYDNTAAQLVAATSDAQLNILFASHNLIGTTYDIATCPSGYSLDVSGGSGNYICSKIFIKPCNTAT